MQSSAESKFSKLVKVFDRVCLQLRSLFLERWKQELDCDWSVQSVELFKNGIGKELFEKAAPIQKEAIVSGDVNRWDITLLVNVLLDAKFTTCMTSVKKKFKERQMLFEIKKVRNEAFHHPNPNNIEDKLFENLWTKAAEALQYFGGSTDGILEVDFSSNSNDSVAKLDANILMEEGKALYNAGNLSDAVDLFTKAISCNSLPDLEMSILYSSRSAAYIKMVEQNQCKIGTEYICLALQDAKEAVNLNPDWYLAHFRVGTAYMALNEFGEALKYFESAAALNPTLEELICARDNCRIKLDERQNSQPNNLAPVDTPEKGSAIVFPGASHVRQAHKYMLTENYKLAVESFNLAAVLGNAEAIYNSALLHMTGRGVKKDLKEAMKLMHRAASAPPILMGVKNVGVADAETMMGVAYETGIYGVEKDCAEAVRWYQRGSNHGDHDASSNIAMLLITGYGGMQLDRQKAVKYWKRAVSQGSFDAMSMLASYYLRVERDPVQAKHWQNLGVRNGHKGCQSRANNFETILKALQEETNRFGEESNNLRLREKKNQCHLREKGITGVEIIAQFDFAGIWHSWGL